MPLTKQQKIKVVEDLKDKIGRNRIMIFVNFHGLGAKSVLALRKKLKESDSILMISKKTLLDLACQSKGLRIPIEKLGGQLGTVFGFQDAIAPAKIIHQFSRENDKLKISGGYFENSFRESEDIIFLASLPPKDILLAQFLNQISSPVIGFLNALQGNTKGLLYILSTIKKS